MKKKFLSGILALVMILAVFVPIMAEPSPHRDNQATLNSDPQTVTTGGNTVTISKSENTTTEDPWIVFKNSTMTDQAAADTAKAQNSDAAYVTVFKLVANDPAANLISNNAISFKVRLNGALKGQRYYVYRLDGENGSIVQTMECSVEEDGVLTIKGINICNTFIVAKDPSSSGSGSGSGTGVVTCEDANGKGWVWSESKGACVYSVTNTSTK